MAQQKSPEDIKRELRGPVNPIPTPFLADGTNTADLTKERTWRRRFLKKTKKYHCLMAVVWGGTSSLLKVLEWQ